MFHYRDSGGQNYPKKHSEMGVPVLNWPESLYSLGTVLSVMIKGVAFCTLFYVVETMRIVIDRGRCIPQFSGVIFTVYEDFH